MFYEFSPFLMIKIVRNTARNVGWFDPSYQPSKTILGTVSQTIDTVSDPVLPIYLFKLFIETIIYLNYYSTPETMHMWWLMQIPQIVEMSPRPTTHDPRPTTHATHTTR